MYEAKAFETIYTHTLFRMIMEEQKKINQDQGRKQTAERLNFRFFFFIFYYFLTVEGSFLVKNGNT